MAKEGDTVTQTHEFKTIGEVAALVGRDRWRLAYLIERGVLPEASVRVRGRRLFTPDDVQQVRAALAARALGGPPPRSIVRKTVEQPEPRSESRNPRSPSTTPIPSNTPDVSQ